jgi:transcription elongation factor S-II
MALDAQAVDRKRQDLEKAVKDGAPATSIALILNELKTGVVPSEKLLRDTKIGVVVNKFRSHKDPAVAKLSIEMVNTWRNAMKSSKSSASTPKPVANGTASPAPAASASPAPKEVKVEKKRYPGDVAKRNSKTDNVNTSLLGNSTRDSCLSLLYNGLAHMSSERMHFLQHPIHDSKC